MADLVTLAQVKAALSIATTSQDAVLAALITTASDAVQNKINRQLSSLRRTEAYDGHGYSTLILRDYPVTEIHAVTINGQPVPQALAWGQRGWAKIQSGVGIALFGMAFERGQQNIAVDYTAGYTSIPAAIQQAVIDTVALWHKRRELAGVTSKSIGGESVAFVQDALPPSAALLSSYMRVTP